jgi:anti-anti-sigma regulatory factor
MLRIVEEDATNNSMRLRLDGRLVGQWVGLLRSSCEQAFHNDGRLVLDLAGVSFADHEGVQLLQQLEQLQVTIINCSPFLREQLKQPTNGLTSGEPPSE